MITLMVACVHVALTLRLKFKKKGEPLLVFTGLWFAICAIIFWLDSGNYKIVSWKKKSLKASKISSFFLILYFVIAEDSLYISTNVLFVAIINYGIVFFKKTSIEIGSEFPLGLGHSLKQDRRWEGPVARPHKARKS
jgi:hypothetical protein